MFKRPHPKILNEGGACAHSCSPELDLELEWDDRKRAWRDENTMYGEREKNAKWMKKPGDSCSIASQ